MHSSSITQAVILALVATVAAAPAPIPAQAPTPIFFPGVAFHGVPQARPTQFALNETNSTHHEHPQHSGSNHTLPTKNLTHSGVPPERPHLLANVDVFLREHFYHNKRDSKTGDQHHLKRYQSSHPEITAKVTPTTMSTVTKSSVTVAASIKSAIHQELGEVAAFISAVEGALPTGLLKQIESEVKSLRSVLPTPSGVKATASHSVVGTPVSFPLAATSTSSA